MFQRNVVVVHAHDIGELHDILYKNKDLVAIDRDIDEIWKDMQEVVKPRIHNSNGISFGINGDVYIFLRENRSSILVHEAVHAAGEILESIGSKCDELRAYIVEYIFLELCWGRKNEKGGPKVR